MLLHWLAKNTNNEICVGRNHWINDFNASYLGRIHNKYNLLLNKIIFKFSHKNNAVLIMFKMYAFWVYIDILLLLIVELILLHIFNSRTSKQQMNNN